MSQQIQLRRDTAANWTSINPILAEGEMGVDTTVNEVKIGDGVTHWNLLPYYAPGSAGAGFLVATNNLSDLNNVVTARTNLGLGTAALNNTGDFDASGAASTVQTNLNTHTGNTSNPHSVTKTQVGLSNVDNIQQLPLSYLDIDNTLAANSDSKVASQKAIKAYVDTGLNTKLGKDANVITVADAGADYTSISAAITHVASLTPTATNPYIISVGPGVYSEPTLVVPAYTSIIGSGINATIVNPSTAFHNIFELNGVNIELSFMTIQGAGFGYVAVLANNTGNFVQIHKVSMYDNDTHIRLNGTSIDSIMYLEYVDIDNVYSSGIEVISRNGFLAKVNAENFYTLPTAVVSGSHLLCDGTKAQLFILAAGLLGTADIGIEVVGGGYLSAQAMYMDGFSTAIQASSFGAGATLDLNDIDFKNNTVNIAASNAATSGQFTGYSETGKITKNSSASFFVTLDLKEDISNKSTDNTLAGHSNILYPSQAAVKDYADTKVAANSAITGATKTKITYDSKGLVTSGADANLDDLGDVVIASPLVDEVLKYNGTNWVNGAQTTTNAGAGVDYFLTSTGSGIGSPVYDLMSKTPDNAAEVDETIVVNNQTLFFEGYIADTVIGGTQIDPGFWNFSFYTYTSLATGTNTLTIDVYKRTSGGTETLLFSATSGNILNTSVSLIEIKSVQGAFSVNATDKLLFKVNATTTNVTNTTLHLVHSGTTHYSFVATPLITRHNDLAGLQGGTSGQQYHLTSAEYTGTGTGNFVRATSPTIATPILTTPNASNSILTGTSVVDNISYDLEGVVSIFSKDVSKARFFTWSTTASGSLYTLVGDLVMWGLSHNFGINPSTGDMLGRDEADTCQMLVLTENGEFKFYTAPSAIAGSVPTFSLKATIDANGFTGEIGTSTAHSAIVTTLNALTLSAQASGFTISGGTSSKTLTVAADANVSGTNTGDQTISDATISLTDITTNNFSTTKHGFVPKGTNIGNFLKDDGTWATPSSGGGGTPATTVTNETTYGITPAVGVSTLYARADHTHGTMATPDKTTVGLGNVDNTADTAKVISGDVTGTLGASTVAKLQNRTMATTAPSNTQVIGWNSTSTQWEPQGGVSVLSTANSALTLTSSSIDDIVFIGNTPGQSVILPVATTLFAGKKYLFSNKSTVLIPIKTSDSAILGYLYPESDMELIVTDATTSVGTWYKENGVTVSSEKVVLFDDFISSGITSGTIGELPWTLVAATGHTVSYAASTVNEQGVIVLGPGTGIAAGGGLHLGNTSTVIGGGVQVMEWRVRFPTLSTATQEYEFYCGLSNTITTTAEITNGIYFAYQRASNVNWTLKTAATTRTTVASATAVTANTWYKLTLVINAAGTQVDGYVNGVFIGTSITTTIPTVAMSPVILSIKTVGTTDIPYQVDYAMYVKNWTTVR
jgi:hypothetical protein